MRPKLIDVFLENTARVARTGFSKEMTHGQTYHVLGVIYDKENLTQPFEARGYGATGLRMLVLGTLVQFDEGLSGRQASCPYPHRPKVCTGPEPTDLKASISGWI